MMATSDVQSANPVSDLGHKACLHLDSDEPEGQGREDWTNDAEG